MRPTAKPVTKVAVPIIGLITTAKLPANSNGVSKKVGASKTVKKRLLTTGTIMKKYARVDAVAVRTPLAPTSKKQETTAAAHASLALEATLPFRTSRTCALFNKGTAAIVGV